MNKIILIIIVLSFVFCGEAFSQEDSIQYTIKITKSKNKRIVTWDVSEQYYIELNHLYKLDDAWIPNKFVSRKDRKKSSHVLFDMTLYDLQNEQNPIKYRASHEIYIDTLVSEQEITLWFHKESQ